MITRKVNIDLGSPPVYVTDLGAAYCGDSRDLLARMPSGSVNLVVTSPPFALQRQKTYGNKDQEEYIEWLSEFAKLVHRALREEGSFVLDWGCVYCDDLGFFLAEDFYWFNPSKLPRSCLKTHLDQENRASR